MIKIKKLNATILSTIIIGSCIVQGSKNISAVLTSEEERAIVQIGDIIFKTEFLTVNLIQELFFSAICFGNLTWINWLISLVSETLCSNIIHGVTFSFLKLRILK